MVYWSSNWLRTIYYSLILQEPLCVCGAEILEILLFVQRKFGFCAFLWICNFDPCSFLSFAHHVFLAWKKFIMKMLGKYQWANVLGWHYHSFFPIIWGHCSAPLIKIIKSQNIYELARTYLPIRCCEFQLTRKTLWNQKSSNQKWNLRWRSIGKDRLGSPS